MLAINKAPTRVYSEFFLDGEGERMRILIVNYLVSLQRNLIKQKHTREELITKVGYISKQGFIKNEIRLFE